MGGVQASKNTMNQVSIIIPAYNAERFLAATLDSVLAQTFADWECVIVDDGSSDRTGAIAEEYAQRDGRFRAVHQANGGQAAARNSGIEAGNPECPYIIFLDSDDLWEPDALEVLTGTLSRHPEAVGAHGMARYIDENDNPIRIGELEEKLRTRHIVKGSHLVSIPAKPCTTFEMLATFGWDCIVTGAIMVRHPILSKVGLFDTKTDGKTCEDWDMWLRISRYGDFAFIDKVVLNYRQYGANMCHVSQDSSRMVQGELYVRRKAYNCPDNTPEQREQVAQAFRAAQRYHVGWKLKFCRESLSRGDFVGATKQAAYAARHFARMIQGRP